ncbi:MAG: Ig-like domain-containing protein [Candidatus Stygibacter australis]|nr:Ig-like domain-containing protein [Candidatus Stygibacter australis]MDP8323000.1 Ig-like domain-containing protein [Candidatus Stygibacter australis]
MKKVFSFLLLLFVFLFAGCGNKENATGGPEDIEKPYIMNVYPAQYEDITGSNIEITFSKPMDIKTFNTGLHIYPEIFSKSFRWENNTLIIEIQEMLIPNSNYYFSFSKNIKGYHNNPLQEQYDLVWANGKLKDWRISGDFAFEDIEDSQNEVRISLFSADTTLIYTRKFIKNYAFESLNETGHFLRAYVDKNKNNRLDIDKEPFAEENTPARPIVTADLFLAYSDSTAPALIRATPLYIDEIDLSFDEPLVSVQTVHLFTDSLGQALQVKRWRIADDKLRVISAEMDTVDYKIMVIGAEDKKGNIADIDSLVFSATTRIDTLAPQMVKIDPRDGSSVSVLQPEIKFTFSEVIFKEHAKGSLTEVETGLKYPLKAISGDNEIVIFKPLVKLNNFNTYRILLDVQDPRGNKLTGFEGSVFLPIVREDIRE